MNAIRSYQPELSGIHFSFNERNFYSSISSPVRKRSLETSGYLFKRAQTCSVSNGQTFTCPDDWHCTSNYSCEPDRYWYNNGWNSWWGAGVGCAVIAVIVVLFFIRRRRNQRQKDAQSQLSIVVPPLSSGPRSGYDYDEQYGYPIVMEPIGQPIGMHSAREQGHHAQAIPLARAVYSPPASPPPQSLAPSPALPDRSGPYEASGSSPPEYVPAHNAHDVSMDARKN